MTTYAQVEAGEKLVFKFGAGDITPGPETFAAACSINTERKLEMISELRESTTPPCDDPSAPSKKTRRVESIDLKFTGAGIADMPSFKTLKNLWKAGQPFNGKLIEDIDANGWTITGAWVIENMSIGGTKGQNKEFDISLAVADGDWEWVDD
jgi:hypothetical protein